MHERQFNHVGCVPSKCNSFAGGDFEERGCGLLGLGDGEDAGCRMKTRLKLEDVTGAAAMVERAAGE